MTGLRTLPRGCAPQPAAGGGDPAPASASLAFRRYLLLSSGISSTALGLALIVSFFATGYGEPALATLAVADGSSVRVAAAQMESLVLAEAPGAVTAPEPTAAADQPPVAAESAGAIDARNLNPRGEPSPVAAQPTPTPAAGQGRSIVPPGATPPATPRPAAVVQPLAALVTLGRIENVNLTFYDCLDQGFCGTMKSGAKVYEGAAACSWDLPEGTRLRIVGDPTQRTYVCEDRGLLEDTWVDVFFYDPSDGWEWQEAVGRTGTIEIVRLP